MYGLFRESNEREMSSSLLLGNFTSLQEQHQSTQFLSTNPLMSPTLAFRFYDKDVDTFCDTSTKPYGTTAETNRSTTITNPSKLKKCTCCPYGYHIDLDFIRYCEELAKNGKQPTNKQLERRNKRRQRKSLEVMLGFNDQWLIDLGKQHTTVTKPQESPFQTVYEVCCNTASSSTPASVFILFRFVFGVGLVKYIQIIIIGAFSSLQFLITTIYNCN